MAKREIDVQVQFKWNGTTWSDETSYLISATGALEYLPPNEAYVSGKQISQQMQVRLFNEKGRFSLYNDTARANLGLPASSPAAYGVECRVRVDVDSSGWEVVFHGYVKIPKEEFSSAEVVFTIWDKAQVARKIASSGMRTDKLEHEIVEEWLNHAGLVSPTDYITAGSTSSTIDYSTMILSHSWLDDEQVWDEIVDIAQATGSRVYIGRDNRVHYEQPYHWALPYDYTPEELSLKSFTEIEQEYDEKAFYDEVVVEYSPRVAGASEEVLWTMSDPLVIEPGETEEFEARLNNPALYVLSPEPDVSFTLTNLRGDEIPGMKPTLEVYGQRVKVSIANTISEPIILMNFELLGQPLVGEPSEQYETEVPTASVYHRRLTVRANAYLQTLTHARSVGEFLAWWYSLDKKMFKVQGVRGVPDRDLGKRIKLTVERALSTVGTGANIFSVMAVIYRVGWNINILPNGAIQYAQELSLIEDVFMRYADGTTPPVIGGTQESAYFLICDTTLGTAKKGLWH